MPPNKGEQSRRGNGPRRTAEPRTSDAQGNSNAVSQAASPQPARAQISTRQSSNIADQSNAQRSSQQPVPTTNSHSSSQASQNNWDSPQRSGQAPPTSVQSSARQGFNTAHQDNAQRSSQQPAPTTNPRSYSHALQDQYAPQRLGESSPTPAQGPVSHRSSASNQNTTQSAPRDLNIKNDLRPSNQDNHNRAQSSNQMGPRSPSTASSQQHGRGGISNQNITQSAPQDLNSRNDPRPSSTSRQNNRDRLQSNNQAGSSLSSTASRQTPVRGGAFSLSDNHEGSRNQTQEGRNSDIYLGRNGRPGQIPAPSQRVMDAEDDFVRSDSTAQQRLTSSCIRPGYCSAGNHTILWTNYLELKMPSEGLLLYSYSMTVDPDANNKVPKGDRKTRLIRLLLENDGFLALLPDVFATDFNATIITKKPLVIKPDECGEKIARFTIDFKAEGAVHAPVVPITYTVCIKYTSVLNHSDLVGYLDPSKRDSSYNKSPILQAFNIILGHHNNEAGHLARIGTNRFFAIDPQPELSHFVDLRKGMNALRGYYTNTIGATSRTLLNVNISHGVFYKSDYNTGDKSVVRNSSLVSLIRARLPRGSTDYEDLHQFLRGVRISTTHLSAEHKAFGKIRTICGLAMEGDGAKLKHPPQFREKRNGGDPWQVEFYEDFTIHSLSSTASSNDPSAAASEGKIKTPPSRVMEGSFTTVKKFFDRTYPRASKILEKQNPRNPVVNVGTRSKPIYLPAEVCEVLPGQVSRAKLDKDQTTRMINFAKLDPGKCAESIVEQGLEVLGYVSPPTPMSQFGVTVGDDLITVPGRVLSVPSIEYKKIEGKPIFRAPSQGSWNLGGIQLLEPGQIEKYHVLGIALGRSQTELRSGGFSKSASNFKETMIRCGFNSNISYDLSTVQVQKDTIVSGLEKWLRDFSASIKPPQDSSGPKPDTQRSEPKTIPKPFLLVIILPSKNDEPYNTIKTLADTKLGFHTVCVTGESRKFYAENPEQYNANVVLKINLKLGGMNHKLAEKPQALGLIDNGTTMVVGIDVTHPSHGSKEGAPSIFAVVASKDKHLSQWPVRFGVQKASREEVISDEAKLTEMFSELLELWKKGSNNLPENIIIYRDGVSEGQYSAVLNHELVAVRSACNNLYAGANRAIFPRITFVVVAKRHHTRFYPTKSETADKMKNVKCGTVVDRGITQAQTWDFFLQSHSVIPGGIERITEKDSISGKEKKIEKQKPSGTARPAHYVVLYDEVFAQLPKRKRADELQQITHNMCYLYGPATKAISICPPVYLADKACTRARLYLSDAFRPPTQAEIDKRKDKKDEKPEKPEKPEEKEKREKEEKRKREEEEKSQLKSYQDRIRVHDNLKDTMFYI